MVFGHLYVDDGPGRGKIWPLARLLGHCMLDGFHIKMGLSISADIISIPVDYGPWAIATAIPRVVGIA